MELQGTQGPPDFLTESGRCVVLEVLSVEVLGHIGVESNPGAARVVEANFPGSVWVRTVEEIDDSMVQSWSCSFSQASIILLGGGPPCQGVSGLNASRKGAVRDARSCLYVHVPRVRELLKKYFPWAQVHALMESVASMDDKDREIMSHDFGDDPWKIDAGSMLWCHRPRLYWVTWDLMPEPGVQLVKEGPAPAQVILTAKQSLF